MFIILFISFGLYVHSEKLVDKANLHRQISYKLADQLRQSSDDLSQMARSYVATQDPRYKKYYLDVLAIRNGMKPKPQGYSDIYWDLVLANESFPSESGEAISLLQEMHQSGFTELELRKMAEAIAYSNHLAALELEAMKLIEDDGPDAEINHTRAKLMLHDEEYYHVKVMIMQPINEFYAQVNAPNLDAVRNKKEHAFIFRSIFIFVFLITIFLLWRFYKDLHITLGAPADEIHALMFNIGRGNFSTQINIKPEMHKSVISGLFEMQKQLHDIEIERKRTEEQLHVAAAFFESQEAMMITNSDNIILRVNQAFTRITGYSATEVVGQSSRFLRSDRHSEDFYQDLWRTVKITGGWQGELWGRRKNGEIYPKWLTISVVKDKQNQITHYITMHSDITIHKKAEDKIRELAFFDQLTNLPNRRLLLDRLKQSMINSARSGKYDALLFIDLDNFKTLNDTLGHDMGDMLLKQVSQRLTRCIRSEDTVARLGGDEFIVMLVNLSSKKTDAATQAEVIGHKILATLNQPYQLNEVAYHGTPSIGVTLFKGHQTSIEDLMRQADLAMYRSKETGRNTLHFFDPEMEISVLKRAAQEKDLHEAVLRKQFMLHFQAQVNSEHQITGAEVLVRWQHPNRGMLLPCEFISMAEETELILPMGQWVLETVCAQLAAWAVRPEMAHLTIAVNVSIRQFHQHDFVDKVLSLLKHTGANPQRLKLELTESLMALDIREISQKMSKLREHGVGFSLDDFGTGYSSLSYLRHLPMDQLKIDRSFVHDVISDTYNASIAKSIIVLAKNLDLSIIAEGVETIMQRDFLSRAGCSAYQGYLFSHPLPLNRFEQLAQRGLTYPIINQQTMPCSADQ